MNKSSRSRIKIVFILFTAIYLIILIHIYRIQIIQHTFFVELGKKQYSGTITTFPPRAPLYDRSGKQFLAMNKDSLAAFILPKKLTSPQTLKPFLHKYFPQAALRLNDYKNSHFMYICRRLTDEQLELIKKHAIPDIQLLNEPNRFYPVASAGHIIGITDIDNKGLFGLELLLEKSLAGKPTTYSLEQDARSGHYYFKRQMTVEGKDGTPIALTIDSNLQFLAHEELKKTIEQFQAKEGAVLIMDPKTGHIIAMASWPNFDPNNTHHISMDHTKNRIITEEYELGSVIKVFAAMAALEEGVVEAEELIDCENVKTTFFQGRKINTVPASVAGIIPFCQVIEKSNNIGIAKVAKRVETKLYDHYTRVGFGKKKTGVQFIGERSGFINPPQRWSKQSVISLSYGYEMTATLLQLAQAFGIIANNGYLVAPTLLMSSPLKKSAEPLYSKKTIETIQHILEKTVLQGTAKKAHIKGYKVLCKTGTANLLVNGQYCPTSNIYTSGGYVEKGDYQRVIVTFIKESPQKNLYASSVSTPFFERIAEKTLINDKII